MKITRQKLKQIITEEMDDLEQDLERAADERGDPAHPQWDHFYDEDELSVEDKNRYVEAYNIIGKAVESGTLPESVEDAVFDMLGKLGINL
jgi:hypothetical protein